MRKGIGKIVGAIGALLGVAAIGSAISGKHKQDNENAVKVKQKKGGKFLQDGEPTQRVSLQHPLYKSGLQTDDEGWKAKKENEKKKAAQQVQAVADSKSCDYCGELIEVSANFCPFCGKGMRKKKRFCINCGAALENDSRFCLECGKKV